MKKNEKEAQRKRAIDKLLDDAFLAIHVESDEYSALKERMKKIERNYFEILQETRNDLADVEKDALSAISLNIYIVQVLSDKEIRESLMQSPEYTMVSNFMVFCKKNESFIEDAYEDMFQVPLGIGKFARGSSGGKSGTKKLKMPLVYKKAKRIVDFFDEIIEEETSFMTKTEACGSPEEMEDLVDETKNAIVEMCDRLVKDLEKKKR